MEPTVKSCCRRGLPGLLLILVLTVTVAVVVTPYDYAWTRYLADHKAEALAEWMSDSLFEGERLGGSDPPVMLFALCVVLYFLAWRRRASEAWIRWRPRLGFILVSGFVQAICVVYTLKWGLGRARPNVVFDGRQPYTAWCEFGPFFVADGHFNPSFTSGHASCAFLLMPMAYALGLSTRSIGRRIGGVLLGLLAIGYVGAMTVGRSMTHSHWVTDGLMQLCFGWIVTHLCYYTILRVPMQCEAPPTRPYAWEFRMSWWLTLFALGCLALITAVRAPGYEATWLVALVVPAVPMMGLAARQLRGLWRRAMD